MGFPQPLLHELNDARNETSARQHLISEYINQTDDRAMPACFDSGIHNQIGGANSGLVLRRGGELRGEFGPIVNKHIRADTGDPRISQQNK
jgi:hypothetical protein